MTIRMWHEDKLLATHDEIDGEVEFTGRFLHVHANNGEVREYILAVFENKKWKCMDSDLPITNFEIG